MRNVMDNNRKKKTLSRGTDARLPPESNMIGIQFYETVQSFSLDMTRLPFENIRLRANYEEILTEDRDAPASYPLM